jgi:tripartite-type tricarboxylate transporter receptor subunit TctC
LLLRHGTEAVPGRQWRLPRRKADASIPGTGEDIMGLAACLRAVCTAAALACAGGAAMSADFYQGKTIRIVVFTTAGGEYDTWARLTAKHLPRHIPGEPQGLVQNMPGGGGIVAGNYLANVAPRDGTVLGLLSRNIPFQAMMKDENIRFDPRQFGWLGSPELTNRVCVARRGTPIEKAEDLFERQMIVGGTGAGSAASTIPPLLSKLLGMKMKLIEGYPGAVEVKLAMEKGEVHGICQSYASFPRAHPGEIESGLIRVLFNMERDPIPGVAAPSIFSFTKTDEQRQILALMSSSVAFGRPIFAPGGIPPERLALLRDAFAKMVQDPEFRADAEHQALSVSLLRGEPLAQMINTMLDTPEPMVRRVVELLK